MPRTIRPFARCLALAATLVLALAPAARTQTWNEVGDAGDMIASAQVTVGVGPFTTINGALGSAGDVDMYCVELGTSPRALGIPAVRLQCVMVSGPDVWVFDANGNGVGTDQICQGGFKTVTTALFPSPGTYYVAVAYSGVRPQSAGGSIWDPGALVERTPDGPGAASPLTGWAGSGNVAPVNPYQITLDYITFCDAATPAAKPTWGSLKLRY